MLAKRIIACLDVRDDKVVKGVQFKQHRIVGDIVVLAKRYSDEGIDELVFYDINASSEERSVCPTWVNKVAAEISIPFCVAGGITNSIQARNILNAGADKLSINSPALARPDLIDELSLEFGKQCITVGIDSKWVNDNYYVFQYTGCEKKVTNTGRKTVEWVKEIQQRGAGEIVLNCMQADGMRQGFDITQFQKIKSLCQVPVIASGGAGNIAHFIDVFNQTNVSGALAASIFHQNIVSLQHLKQQLKSASIEVRYE